MKWIKFKDKTPPVGDYHIRDGELKSHTHFTDIAIKNGYWAETNYEWLDETPDDKDKEIERLKALLKKNVTGGCGCESCVSLWNNFQDDNNL